MIEQYLSKWTENLCPHNISAQEYLKKFCLRAKGMVLWVKSRCATWDLSSDTQHPQEKLGVARRGGAGL